MAGCDVCGHRGGNRCPACADDGQHRRPPPAPMAPPAPAVDHAAADEAERAEAAGRPYRPGTMWAEALRLRRAASAEATAHIFAEPPLSDTATYATAHHPERQ